MSETFFEEVIRYVRFTGADQERLRAFHPVAQPRFAEITDVFYERVREHEEALAVFQSDAQVERLKVSLRAWMGRVLLGPWDEAYHEASARIGRMHVKVKLPQRFMFTAMAVIRSQLGDIAVRELPPGDRAPTVQALSRAIDLELAIMLETYREDYVAALQRFERLERDLLQRRLVVSETRYQALIEGAGVVVVGVDPEHKVQIFNPGAEQLTGFAGADVLGTDYRDVLCHPGDAAAVGAVLTAALRGERPLPFESRVVDRRGRQHWVRWHAAQWEAAGGALVCLLGFDVTADRALAARTRRAEHLASLGTLAAGLAHEIRNPLNAAQLQLQLAERRIRRAGGADDALAATGAVRDELQRLAGLVGDFLAFARPLELHPASADLAQIAANAAALLDADAGEAGVALSIDAPHPVVARVDAGRIEQVLVNLARNGIDAAGRGGLVVIAARRGQGAAEVAIADTGPGLPEGIDVFEPFTSTKDGGTGLGLPIAHRIVTDHGGDIAVARRDDRTVFTVILPLDGPA